MSNQAQYVTAALVTVGAVGGAYCAYYLYKESEKSKIPTEWKQVGTLKDLYMYPIKSCGPIKLDKAECFTLGLKDCWRRDRVLMVINENRKFCTARTFPDLLLVQPTIRGSVLTLTHSDMEPVHVNLAEVIALQQPKTATVWDLDVPVLDCGYEASEWFSRLIDRSTSNYRLVYYASQNPRIVRNTANRKFYKYTKNDAGALPDEVAFNLVNEASVEDLNTRLKDAVTHRNFRPNFVLAGAKAYDEDNWKFVKIGENVFEIIKPCFRCVLTTIDPETGVRNPDIEPLTTLKKYRQVENLEERRASGNSPRMGLQLALRSGPGGIVSINDPIYVA